MNITNLLGKRCLLQIGANSYRGREITEFKILEISPSGNWVKLMNIHGNKFWRAVTEISFVEELIDLKAECLPDISAVLNSLSSFEQIAEALEG